MKEIIMIALIAGTRPEFVQAQPILLAMESRNMDYRFVHTGQHYDYRMSRIFFEELNLPEPDVHLEVPKENAFLQIGKMIPALHEYFKSEHISKVIVLGDTNSTLAGAFVARRMDLMLIHNEAGMRSFDMRMPEEQNRIMVDHISDILTCPTKTAVKNLRKEGIETGVHLVGDVMFDSFLNVKEKLDASHAGMDLMTVHRAENTDDPYRLRAILDAVGEAGHETLFPIHPRTKKVIEGKGISIPQNIEMIPPLGYLAFLSALISARKVITDSGGVQKQAYFASKPCITLRENTEWVETVEDGWNVLAGADKEKIIWAINEFQPVNPQKMVFGDGKAGERIVDILIKASAYSE